MRYCDCLLLIVILLACLTGCMIISLGLTPEDPTVRPLLKGEDCVPIILGFGFGTATVERARTQGLKVDAPYGTKPVPSLITKLRSVELHDEVFYPFGWRCVIVTGE